MVKDGLHTECIVGPRGVILSKKYRSKPDYPSSYIVGPRRLTLYCITRYSRNAYFRFKMAKMQEEYDVLVGEFESEG